MNNINEKSLYLSSLVVFRELYDANKDIYAVISEFLSEVIISNSKKTFHITEITHLLKSSFEFKLPEAVVATALKRLNFVNKNQGVYVVDESRIKDKKDDLKKIQGEIQSRNNAIVEDLLTYIEKNKNKELSTSDKKAIIHSLCSYIMDESDEKQYSKLISAFIVENKHKEGFRQDFNKIREGVILYSGIKNNTNINEKGSWDSELTFYLDTEIIFHSFGLNGMIFKSLFDDFFSYVKEINGLNNKRLIKLKYFETIKDEIKSYYTRAEMIVCGKESLHPKDTAMKSIVEGCKSPSDVVLKQIELFSFLKTSGIMEDETSDYYRQQEHKYNCIDEKTAASLTEKFGFDVTEHLEFLNRIQILRKDNKSRDFYRTNCIFLTGNNKTIKLAISELRDRTVPLATNLFWITNKLWFKLNRGFGDDFPKSFDIITKAQIVLSFIINENVEQKFKKFQSELATGSLTKEKIQATIYELKKGVRKPEEIEEVDAIELINEEEMEIFAQEHDYYKKIAASGKEENKKLKKELSNIEQELIFSKNNELLLKKDVLCGKQELLDIKKKEKTIIDKEVDKAQRKFKAEVIILNMLLAIFPLILVLSYEWGRVEGPIWFITFVIMCAMLPTIKAFDKDKKRTYFYIIQNCLKNIRIRIHDKYNFDEEFYTKIENEVIELRKEIADTVETNNAGPC